MIKLDRVTKQYGTKTAVHELSLDIAAGELFAFLGPNGAGKTTTIKMMCALLFPTPGAVYIGGHDLRRDGDRARRARIGLGSLADRRLSRMPRYIGSEPVQDKGSYEPWLWKCFFFRKCCG